MPKAEDSMSNARPLGSDDGGTDTGMVTVTHGLPPVEVTVAPNTSVTYEGVAYDGGDTILMEGPIAQNLAVLGHVIL